MRQIKTRSEIPDQYTWNLEEIYASLTDWEQDYQSVKEDLPRLAPFREKSTASPLELWSVLQLSEQLERTIARLFVYSRMKRDEDNNNSAYQALFDRAEALSIEFGTASSFIVPEISSLESETLARFQEQEPRLCLYRHYFDQIMRQKEHILPPGEERLLAMAGDLSMTSSHVFNMLNNADLTFPTMLNEEGEEIEITKGRFAGLMESRDRRVREEAFRGLYSSYMGLKNTLATTLSSSVKKDIFHARARNYPSALEASLFADKVPVAVYDQLIASVHDNLEAMYRYVRLRQKVLQLEELHMYDLYTPLLQEYRMQVPYEEAREMVLNGVQVLGDDYRTTVEKAFSSGWIDVYENKGKTGGAYSWGTYDTLPYILMNYDNKINDVFTLAHELGHSLHSYYSDRNQPWIYSQYPILLAEVASTVNESLLIDYLLEKSKDKNQKIFLLNYYLEQYRGTVYRQTMFAEFEKIIHREVEQGGVLTPEYLSSTYRDLNRLYYGPDMVLDPEIVWEWARIPHFYSAFYVYKYATGFAAAGALKKQILTRGREGVDRYLQFLSAGCSDYPIALLQQAGVDLTTPGPVNDALEHFSGLVTQLEELL